MKYIYVVVDYDGNVYGACDSPLKATEAMRALREHDPKTTFDWIECEINEIEIDGRIVYKR